MERLGRAGGEERGYGEVREEGRGLGGDMERVGRRGGDWEG